MSESSELKYFMWQWQRPFRYQAAYDIRCLLGSIDADLDADTFLVGFRVADDPEGHELICVSPEDCRFQPERFRQTAQRAEQLASEDPRSRLRSADPRERDMYKKEAQRDGWRHSVEQTLTDQDPGCVFFASEPTLVNGYTVLVIVQLDRARLDMHYRLTGDFNGGGQMRHILGQSLIETTVRCYLASLVEKLKLPDPGHAVDLNEDYSSIHRAAAQWLMRAPVWAGGDVGGAFDMYDICNAISLQNYEGTEGAGRLAFVRPDHPAIRVDIKLRTPVSLRDIGAVRKLLQMGSGNLCLLCDSSRVYGLGTVCEYDPAGEDLFVVRFVQRFTWELFHGEQLMMYCRDGQPRVGPPRPSVAPVRDTLERIFPSRQIDHLVDLAGAVIAQPHGAMLVVALSAAEEAKRLSKQATVVEPFTLTPELINLVTVIDGAVLVDIDGTCHAIGVILDGMASEKCTSSRGARYNSGVRYAYPPRDRVVIVKSEDGMVNVLPDSTSDAPGWRGRRL